MTTDKRADKIFRKRYHLKGKQVKSMQDTFEYQALVLKLLAGDFIKLLKQLLKGEL